MSLFIPARDEIRSGDVLAYRSGTFLGELIEYATGGSYCHCAIVWCFRGRVFLLEAKEGRDSGVRLRALSHALPCDWLATSIGWTDELEAFALQKLGLPYSYFDAIKVGLGFTPSPSGEICSLYVGSILAKAGVLLARKGLTPATLVDDLLDRGAVLKHLSA